MSELGIVMMNSSPSGLLAGITQKLSELDAAVNRQADRLSAVLEIGIAITSARDVDQLLGRVMDRLTVLLNAEASTLFMFDEEKQELWSRVLRGPRSMEIRVPVDRGIVGHVVQTGNTLLLGDAYQDLRFNPDIDRKSGFRTRSVIAAPLRHVSGRILGCVEVLDRKVNAFTRDDLLLVEAVASQIAGVLDNVLLYEQLRAQNDKLKLLYEQLSAQNEQLKLLYEVERAVSSAQRQEEFLDQILAKATSLVGAPVGSVLLSDLSGSIHFRTIGGGQSEVACAAANGKGRGIAARVTELGKPLRLSAEEARRLHGAAGGEEGAELGAVLCVPILGEDRILGCIELLDKPGGFTEDDERLAILLAGQTGRAILLRHAREEGERRARMEAIGQMLSGVLHDLRTPMTVISGYAQLVVGERNEDERKRVADVIEKQVEHINAMTRETLAFARGERELLLRTVPMHRFIQEVREFLLKDLERTQVKLEIRELYTGAARFDENKLKRLVYNIARNAVQAMPDGGQFTLTVDRQEDEIVLLLEDNGQGIPPEIADRLFQSFVTSGKTGGTGLGLAIVKKIAEEHGGRVGFRSAVGQGTTFEVRFPAGVSRKGK